MDYLVTIIVPVYKAEKYIELCVHKLFEQTFRSIEYVFVDDYSPDNSIAVIQQAAVCYPQRADDIRYIRHFRNRGVAAARNTGLLAARGHYIIFCDSDDWMEPDTIERMYGEAIRMRADIVWTDFYYTYQQYEIRSVQKNELIGMECVKAMLCEQMHGGLWNKLVRRELYVKHNICFLPGFNVWEDLRVCVQLFSYAKSVAYLPDAFYHYVQYHKTSVSSGATLNVLHDTIKNADSIISFLLKNGMRHKLNKHMHYLKLAAKRNLLTMTHRRAFMRWRLIYPEANNYILSYRVLPLRMRLLGWCVAHGWWPVVNGWIYLKKKRL